MSSLEKEKYEKLQEEYKKLFSEYEQLRDKDPQSSLLEKKVEQLSEKQNALKITLEKISSLNS